MLVSIDTLRADRLPAYGYGAVETPAIDALARDAQVFDAAYSHYPLTLPSHFSMMTGLFPPGHGVRDNVGYPFDDTAHPTLAARLAAAGYATGGFVASFVLRRETGFATGFQTFDEPPAPRRGAPMDAAQRSATATLEPALAWLRERAGQPLFLFLHFYEPHTPYTPPEPYRSRYADPYDGEVAAADAAVGTLIAELERLGLYDDALVVLVSDHGEGLGDHGEHQHGVFLYRSTLHVPMLVKRPGGGGAGTRIARTVGLVDVAPTLARAAGLDWPAGGDGRDLFEEEPPPDRALYAETYYPRLHFGWSDLQALIEPRWYLVRAPEPELFDVVADPGQQTNVLRAQRREFARLSSRLDTLVKPLAAPHEVDAETAKNLAALGYLSASRSVTEIDLPDPKSQRHLLAGIEEGLADYWAERYEAAAAKFRGVLAENPGMSDLWAYLARALDRLGRTGESVAAWERVLELSGGNASVALLVAERYVELGNLDRAEQIVASVEAADPAGALDLAAQIALARGRGSEAEALMRRAAAEGVASEVVLRRLALDALGRGRPADALALLDRGADELEAPSRILKSLALADAGRATEGEAELERARRASESGAEFFENLGAALLALERFDRARAAFGEAVRLDPKAASAWNSLGVALLRLQDARGAVGAWQRSVELDPSQADAWFNIGLVASAAGDAPLARRALARFLAVAPATTPEADRRRAEGLLRRLETAG